MSICMIDGCERTTEARGRCHSHFEHWRRRGVDRGPFPETFEDRFWAKVDKSGDCWLWMAATDGTGRYGAIHREGKLDRAHRVAYELMVGPIPNGLVVDHLCRVTLCVNPDHLEPVDFRTNILRGTGQPARNAAKTHCKRGHEFTPENTRAAGAGGRGCITCDIEYHGPRRAARRAAKRAALRSAGRK